MHDKPKLQCTRDYSLFDMHQNNRPLREKPMLLESMRLHGFMPSSPIHCKRGPNGRLIVIRGHHRLDTAKRLGLLVWYIIDDSCDNVFELEQDSTQSWNADDFVHGRAVSGDADCAKVIEFQKKHGLTLGAAASLMGGETAGSTNKLREIKDGTFKVSSDLSHALTVVRVTDYCKSVGVVWATCSAFVAAISHAVRVPEFDIKLFMRRVSLNPARMQRRTTVALCLDEIEALYNYNSKENRLALAFRALEISRSRQRTFGRPPSPKASTIAAPKSLTTEIRDDEPPANDKSKLTPEQRAVTVRALAQALIADLEQFPDDAQAQQ